METTMEVINNKAVLQQMKDYLDMGNDLMNIEKEANCSNKLSLALNDRVSELKSLHKEVGNSDFSYFIKDGVPTNELPFLEDVKVKIREFLTPKTFDYLDPKEMERVMTDLRHGKEDCQSHLKLIQYQCTRTLGTIQITEEEMSATKSIFTNLAEKIKDMPLRTSLTTIKQDLADFDDSPTGKYYYIAPYVSDLKDKVKETRIALRDLDAVKGNVITGIDDIIPILKTQILGVEHVVPELTLEELQTSIKQKVQDFTNNDNITLEEVLETKKKTYKR